MSKVNILWADDEIDLLKPHLFFLEKKGFSVTTVTNGHDAVEEYQKNDNYEVVFLDESMPGMSGLETLTEIKAINPHQSVVMITKNEAENLMEEAIGSQIDDYLIKPVNPNQILLSLKKIIDNHRLVSEKTLQDYQVQFRQISMDISSGLDFDGWAEMYQRLIQWELKLDASSTEQMEQIISMQKSEANIEYSKFVIKNYKSWLENGDGPIMSHEVMKEMVFPNMDDDRPTIVLLLDNLRFDQWKVIEPILLRSFKMIRETYFSSILPTSTQYSRNAIFSGLTPLDIEEYYPEWWLNDMDEGGKNNFEGELVSEQIRRLIRKEIKHEYVKVTTVAQAKVLQDNILNYLNNDLTFIVYNFIDMLSHARTEMEVLKELAGDEKAYRSLTRSWFNNSPLWIALQKIADREVQLFILTDHGTIRVHTPSKVVGDKDTTTNLRYKMGRNLKFNPKDVLEIKKPEEVGLPSPNISSSYIFAKEDRYFLYPNNYNYYLNYFRNTFQHGGISMEEMICPFVELSSR
ncbi:MAG: response regulator [Saprospiraceae bacterium]|nr:response regulator [Saprospiraceae bacterium]